MIITMAPFPSVEYIYDVEALKKNEKVFSKNVGLNVLSKGIYSAQIMKVLQDEPMLIGTIGGFAGKYIKHYLDKSRVKTDVVWSEEETPHCVNIHSKSSNDHYILETENRMNVDKEIERLWQKYRQHIKTCKTLVISGYLPQQVHPSIYGKWIKEAHAHNVKAVVSTGQKEVLEGVLEARPYALMFTKNQLERLGIDTSNNAQIIHALSPYLKMGIHYVAVYLKNQDSMMLSKNKYCALKAPWQDDLYNNTASSGAFLGALAVGISRRYEMEKFSKRCLAAAFAANDNVNCIICTKKDIDMRTKKIKIKTIDL